MTTLEGRAAYELWADTYPAIAHNPLMRVEQEIVALLLARLRAERALDVGTGPGRYVPVLQATGASVVGLDFSLAMLAHGTGWRVCAADIAESGEARPKGGARMLRRPANSKSQRFFQDLIIPRGFVVGMQVKVRVGVDQAGQERGAGKIDDARIGGRLHVGAWSDALNPLAPDQHDPIVVDRQVGAVEDARRLEQD